MVVSIDITLPEDYTEIIAFALETHYDSISGMSGIYYIYDKSDKLLYVGQTKDFYSRLMHHRTGKSGSHRFADDIAYFRIFQIYDGYEREIYETHAIYTLRPSYNISKVYDRKKSDSEIEANDRVYELRDERRAIVDELRDMQDIFGTSIFYGSADISPGELDAWGTYELNKRRVAEIDEEIKVLRRIR